PELPHEEVMEFEVQAFGDVLVGALLVRQADIEANRLPARLLCAAVGCLHDAGAAARGDDEAMVLGLQRQAPGGEETCELAGFFVIPRPLDGLAALDEFRLVL